MLQIAINYIIVFCVPLIIGLVARVIMFNAKHGYLVSIVFTSLFAITCLNALITPSHGSEKYVLMAVQALCAMLSSLIAEVIIQIKKRKQNQ